MGPSARRNVEVRPPAARRLPPAAVFVVLAALLIGVAAALLSGVPPTPTNVTHESGGYVDYAELQVFAVVVLGLTAVWVVYRLTQRLRDPSGAQILRGPVMVWAVCLLLFLGFLIAAHYVGGGAPSTSPAAPGPGNSTGHVPPIGKAANGTPSNFTVVGQTFPGWVAYALVLGVGVAIALVAVPLAYVLAGRRRGELATSPPDPAEAARAAIAATLAELESDPNADPRALIVALYGRLLTAVDARLVDTGARTAREVESTAVARWRIPPEAAGELTRLFEEARYSAHPMQRHESDRARAALERVLAAIDRGAPR